ncbi:hypothetical protein HDV00_006438 [Rhizophlyctis rosea]|nr:hypothetical protein HDV00_006438 [Rhizophlyctis rosea]
MSNPAPSSTTSEPKTLRHLALKRALSTCDAAEITSLLDDHPCLHELSDLQDPIQYSISLENRRNSLRKFLTTAHPTVTSAFAEGRITLDVHGEEITFDPQTRHFERIVVSNFNVQTQDYNGPFLISSQDEENVRTGGVYMLLDPLLQEQDDGDCDVELSGSLGEGKWNSEDIRFGTQGRSRLEKLCATLEIPLEVDALSSFFEIVTECRVDKVQFHRSLELNMALGSR